MAAKYPVSRPRRLRHKSWLRDLVRENTLSVDDLIWPIFVCEGKDIAEPIASLPGVERLSIDRVVLAAKEARALGIKLIALFPGTPQKKRDEKASEAFNPDNLVNRATSAIKEAVPEIGIMLDVALDPYTDHGHDGLVRAGQVDNDLTIEALIRQSLVQAEAGADILGPSDMMDGRIGAIRAALDAQGHKDIAIMAYSAKFASAYYGPFREAIGAPRLGGGERAPLDKKSYQLDIANGDEALLMIRRDIDEGADMIIIKPGLPCLDICARAASRFTHPLFAYQVSGEYAQIEAAIRAGFCDEKAMIMENIMAFKRAGCRGVLTYFAPRIARFLQEM